MRDQDTHCSNEIHRERPFDPNTIFTCADVDCPFCYLSLCLSVSGDEQEQ